MKLMKYFLLKTSFLAQSTEKAYKQQLSLWYSAVIPK